MSSTKNSKKTEHDRLSFKEFVDVFKWVVSTQYSIHKVHAIVYALVRTLELLTPLGFIYVTAEIIDIVLETVQKDGNLQNIYPYLIILLVLSIFENILGSIRSLSYRTLRSHTEAYVKQLIYKRMAFLGVQRLEDPEVTNNISRVNNTAFNMVNYFRQVVHAFGYFVSFCISLALMLKNFPILVPILVIAAIPVLLLDNKYRAIIWSFGYKNTEKRRKAWANAWDLGAPSVLREVIAVNGLSFMDGKFMKHVKWEIAERTKIWRRWFFQSDLLRFLHSGAYYYGYIRILLKLIEKEFTVGAVLFNIRLLDRFVGGFENFTSYSNDIFEYSIHFKDAYKLLNMEPAFEDGNNLLVCEDGGPAVDINNINFTYPKAKKAVLENLSISISPGEKVAIVGHNGAGKTTLAKLLVKIYLPDSGEIKINGTNLCDLRSSSIYANTSILFQDYNTYGQYSVRDNVVMGAVDKKVDDKKIIDALKRADAWDFVQEYEDGLDQILSEQYKGGIRPSTGQWQKIAIARFFYRDAPLIIFDEPTAAIDAVSEYNIFNKIYDFFEGKTVILISHRFSTVRNADRILVVENGKIIEQGSHDELLDLDGYYAKSFKLQAEGYSMEKTESIA